MRKIVEDRDFGKLPDSMRIVGEEAYETLLHTGDGQLCDVIIDRAALGAIYQAGKESPDSGEILLNGHNVRDFDRSDLREGFGMVLQDTWLFNGTIRENVAYAKRDATDGEIEEACRAANADHFISTFAGGYDMVLDDDTNLSGGQRQLLTIARAMVQDSPMLILDEATSNVDTRTEQLIQDAMDRLTAGRTSFVIAHRLSPIKNADLILVMKDGNIIEQGSHDDLLAADGFYASLYNSQFES